MADRGIDHLENEGHRVQNEQINMEQGGPTASSVVRRPASWADGRSNRNNTDTRGNFGQRVRNEGAEERGVEVPAFGNGSQREHNTATDDVHVTEQPTQPVRSTNGSPRVEALRSKEQLRRSQERYRAGTTASGSIAEQWIESQSAFNTRGEGSSGSY